jgi:D-alanyl-lipoteichoic acid acyltransferase DltB (MBOAT superfamily)
MAAFSSAAFPLLVAACYVLGPLNTLLSRTTWFGVLNAVAIGILFGWRSLLALLALSSAYWIAIIATSRLRNDKWRKLASFALYAAAAIIFIMHKTLLEPHNDFSGSEPVASLSRVASAPYVRESVVALQIIALSYVFLRLIDMIRSVLDGAVLLNPLAISGYLVPFFMTPSGPINVYAEHVKMDSQPPEPVTAAHFIDSTFIVVCGYFLKFVVAQSFSIFVLGLNAQWPTRTIGETALFLLYVLIEFTGYSLIALGVGRLLGVPTPINFNHPYLATTVGDFWTRWHMSLGQFVRRNLYTPAQVSLMRRFGRKNREVAYLTNVLALSLPFVFVGIWHRFTWSFLLWGISLAVIVAVEKVMLERVFARSKRLMASPWWLKKGLGILYALSIVVITFHIASRDFVR